MRTTLIAVVIAGAGCAGVELQPKPDGSPQLYLRSIAGYPEPDYRGIVETGTRIEVAASADAPVQGFLDSATAEAKVRSCIALLDRGLFILPKRISHTQSPLAQDSRQPGARPGPGGLGVLLCQPPPRLPRDTPRVSPQSPQLRPERARPRRGRRGVPDGVARGRAQPPARLLLQQDRQDGRRGEHALQQGPANRARHPAGSGGTGGPK